MRPLIRCLLVSSALLMAACSAARPAATAPTAAPTAVPATPAPTSTPTSAPAPTNTAAQNAQRIFFVTPTRPPKQRDRNAELHRMTLSGDDDQLIASCEHCTIETLAVSPDHLTVAYMKSVQKPNTKPIQHTTELRLIDATGAHDRLVTDNIDYLPAAPFSPDGQRLVIGRSDQDARRTLWAISLADGGAEEITPELPGLTNEGAARVIYGQIGWLNNQTLIVGAEQGTYQSSVVSSLWASGWKIAPSAQVFKFMLGDRAIAQRISEGRLVSLSPRNSGYLAQVQIPPDKPGQSVTSNSVIGIKFFRSSGAESQLLIAGYLNIARVSLDPDEKYVFATNKPNTCLQIFAVQPFAAIADIWCPSQLPDNLKLQSGGVFPTDVFWSLDSNNFYYLLFGPIRELHRYDLVNQSDTVLFDTSSPYARESYGLLFAVGCIAACPEYKPSEPAALATR